MKENIKLLIESFFDDIDINLSNIPYKELSTVYKNFEHCINEVFCIDNNLMFLSEALNYSEDLTIVKKDICQKYNLQDWQFDIKTFRNDIQCAAVLPNNNDDRIKDLINDMDKFGYYLSTSRIFTERNLKFILLKFDPKYQDPIKNIRSQMKKIFHISPASNLKSIKQNGFIPSHKNDIFTYPDRVYFIKGNRSGEIEHIVNAIYSFREDKNVDKYICFVIDLNKVSDNIKFYYDSCAEYGIYTEDIIPYNTVTDIYELKKDLDNTFHFSNTFFS